MSSSTLLNVQQSTLYQCEKLCLQLMDVLKNSGSISFGYSVTDGWVIWPM